MPNPEGREECEEEVPQSERRIVLAPLVPERDFKLLGPPTDSRTAFDEEGDTTSEVDFFLDDRCDPFTREQRRSRRKRPVGARTINVSRLAKSALEVGRLLQPELSIERPRTRADCASVPRPCPFVGCRHHLYLDVSEKTGSIKLNFPDLEVWELQESCSLDIADDGRLGHERLGAVLNVTRERIRQLEHRSLRELSRRLEAEVTPSATDERSLSNGARPIESARA